MQNTLISFISTNFNLILDLLLNIIITLKYKIKNIFNLIFPLGKHSKQELSNNDKKYKINNYKVDKQYNKILKEEAKEELENKYNINNNEEYLKLKYETEILELKNRYKKAIIEKKKLDKEEKEI